MLLWTQILAFALTTMLALLVPLVIEALMPAEGEVPVPMPSAERMTTVWNGIPDTPLRADPGFLGRVRIMMVARFAEQKDQHLLLRALSGIDEKFEVDFVGDGPTLLRARQAATDDQGCGFHGSDDEPAPCRPRPRGVSRA